MKKSWLSRRWGKVRESVKRLATFLVASFFRKKSFSVFGVPSGLDHSTKTKHPIYPATTFSMRPPKTIESKLYWRYQVVLGSKISLPEEGILTVREGLATSKGGNLSPQGKLITTFLQAIDGKPPKRHDLFQFSTKKFFPRIYHAHTSVLTLAAGWQGAFYHWVFEVLPRLHLAEKGGEPFEQIYVESKLPFQKESLQLLGIDPKRLICAHEYAAVRAPQLIIPSIPETPTHWGCQFLREKFLPKLPPRSPLRLYISRRDASRRRIHNEEALLPLLKKYRFERVELSSLSFETQASLFQAAEAVVGPHGAGFSHLVFCRPGTPFLELFSPAYFHPCYWHVCDRVGLNYHYLFGEGEHHPDFINPPYTDPDITIDADKLEATFKLMEL